MLHSRSACYHQKALSTCLPKKLDSSGIRQASAYIACETLVFEATVVRVVINSIDGIKGVRTWTPEVPTFVSTLQLIGTNLTTPRVEDGRTFHQDIQTELCGVWTILEIPFRGRLCPFPFLFPLFYSPSFLSSPSGFHHRT